MSAINPHSKKELDNVSFFKVGLQLFIAGGLPTLLQSLREKRVFVDLKVPGDISNTIGAVIDMCIDHRVTFLTLSESMPLAAIRSADRPSIGSAAYPTPSALPRAHSR